MTRSCVIACVAVLAGCGEEPPPTDSIPSHPAMTASPAWSVEGPTDQPGSCFGAATAVADFDGDGQRDLAVLHLGCFFSLAAPGRVGIYRGQGTAFSTTPVWTTLDWGRTPVPAFSGVLAVGDVDGDHRPDLMVSNNNGAIVYAGITSVAAPLAAPTYRVPPLTGRYGRTVLTDVDGDGRSEIVSLRSGTATVWKASGTTLTAVRTFAGVSTVVAAGDADEDGKGDVVIVAVDGTSSLYRGCATTADCAGGLTAAPAWTFDRPVIAMVPDLDGDHHKEAMVRDASQSAGWVWLHLSDPVTGLAAEPSWTSISDPNYVFLGATILAPGDLDGDDDTTDLVMTSAGRVYAFFPRGDHHLDRLEPSFAWPRPNWVQEQILSGQPTFGASLVSASAAGDLDHDGHADLVIAASGQTLEEKPGAVYLFRGGKVRRDRGNRAPYLPGEVTCALPASGLPDVTVDADALARSLYVEEREFAEDACEVLEACVAGPGTRKLLRFTTSIGNLGGGPLIVPGPETAPELYVFDECHGHDHLTDFATYDLVGESGSVAAGRKQGWFMIDSVPLCSDGPASGDYFPDQGVSPGWADVYPSSIPCQWIDVTDVPDGIYTLRVTADTNHLIEQDDVFPDTAVVRLELRHDRVRVIP